MSTKKSAIEVSVIYCNLIVSAGALMISRNVLHHIGGYDELSFMYAEDADICRRIKDQGIFVIYYPEVRLVHYGGQISRLNSYQAIWSYYFAFYHLYKKYYFGRSLRKELHLNGHQVTYAIRKKHAGLICKGSIYEGVFYSDSLDRHTDLKKH